MGLASHLNTKQWQQTRLQALSSAGRRCERCGKAGILECHHKLPLHKGGAPYALSNIEVLCRGCHVKEHKPKKGKFHDAWQALLREL